MDFGTILILCSIEINYGACSHVMKLRQLDSTFISD